IEALLSMYEDRRKSLHQKNGPPASSSDPRARRTSPNGNGHNGVRNGDHKKPALNGHARRSFTGTRSATKDQLVAKACNSWWIHVQWELSPQIIARAEAA